MEGMILNLIRKSLMWLLIPRGVYCEGPDYRCPFLFRDSGKPEQENGYCSYLKKSDWDINEEQGDIVWQKPDGTTLTTEPHEITMSLLWDGCKECGKKWGLK